MRIIIFLLLLAVPAFAIEDDKAMHLGLSTLAGAMTGAVLVSHNPEWTSGQRLALATATATLPGLAKEFNDPVFDGADLAFDVVGAFFGAAISESVGMAFFIEPTAEKFVIGYRGEW